MPDQELLRAHLESGMRAHNQGNIESAKAAYQRALAVAPGHPDALHLLGVALLQLGDTGPALDYLQRAARKLRDDPAVIGNLAHAYFTSGRYAESHAAFRKAGRLDPRNTQFQIGAANSLAMQGKFGAAETLLRKLTARFPLDVLAWLNLGHVVRDQGRADEALACYRRTLELDPHSIDARNSLGNVLHKMQRFEDAEREFLACVRMAPAHLPARCNLASVVIDLGRFGEAADICREIIRIAPGLALSHALLGSALGHQGKMRAALECHRVAAELSPQDSKLVETYASSLTDVGRFSEGSSWFARALTVNPASPSAHQSLGPVLLRHGCFAEGWAEYGYREPRARFREKHPAIALSRTLPPDVSGSHICVLQEQGLGDEIFFLRYAPQLHAAGARITCRASNKLRSLLARVASIGLVLEEKAPPPQADLIMLAGDLPHALSVYPASPLPVIDAGRATVHPRDFPWRAAIFWPRIPPPLALAPLAEQIAGIRLRLAQIGDPPYLGLTWRGGIPPRDQRGVAWTLYKEIDLSLFATALKDFPGTFIALQRKPEAGEIAALSDLVGKQIHDFTDLNEHLEAMLALLALIDEYVGMSNTNMYLRAGAGKTARVLVPCPAEWRWMDEGKTSPWFPGFPIYRQSPRGDWTTALAELKRDLKKSD
jgi:tetratricopeptide (TPR) repeat protein